ncbi:hypothetical protein [Cetobacterium ceti]
MYNKIEKFLNLKLSEVTEIQPFPFSKYIFIKTKTKKNFKINIPNEMEFFESFEKIKNMLGRENTKKPIPKKSKYKNSNKIIYKSNGKTYNRQDLIEANLNIGSLENAINKQKTYFGNFWEKYIYNNGKWEYQDPKLKPKQKIFLFKCLETNEIKDTSEWTTELKIHRNTLIKNVKNNYKTKGLTFQKVFNR